jgi:CHAT domain-containing protein/Tfp pilus assembly protein PilF
MRAKTRQIVLCASLAVGLIYAFAPVLAKKSAQSEAQSISGKSQSDGSPFVNFDRAAEIDALNIKMEKAFQLKMFDQALTLARKSLELSAAHYGKDHYEYAKTLNNVAWYEQNSGDYSSARTHFEQALKLMESNLGADNPKIVPLLNNLSILLAAQGDPSSAAPLLERALTLEEKVVGPDSSDLANTLNNIAVIYDAAGKHDKASAILERAYKIQQADLLNCDPVERALTLSNLALLSQADGNLARAEQLMESSLDLRQKKLSQSDPDLAESMTNLAMIELQLKKIGNADEHLKKALSIIETTLSDQHSDLIPVLNNLAALELSQNNIAQARKYCMRAASILDKHINDVLPGLSFAEQRAFLNSKLPSQIGILISTTKTEDEAAESYNFLFRWKGLLIEALHLHSQMMHLTKHPSLGSEAQRLVTLRSQISDLYHHSSELTLAERKKKMEEFIRSKEELERNLSTQAKESTTDILSGMSLAEFCKLLRDDELLIDFYYYQKPGSKNEAFYAGFISDSSGKIRLQDLGDAARLNQQAKLWLKQTVGKQVSSESEAALKEVFSKLCGEHNDKRLIFCTDSEFNRLPLTSFVPTRSVANLDTPRELAYLRKHSALKDSNRLLAIGGIDFGSSSSEYQPLPGTLIEAEKVAELARADKMTVTILSGKNASKEKFLSALADAERIHIATHGFFSETASSPSYSLESTSGLTDRNLIGSRDPLAKSGLVLSATDNNSARVEVISAEELIGVDLRSCKSLVLSACDTGLGEKDNGQGVLGLRAAVMAAGARSLLISLWKVSDKATVALMEEFYKNILEKHQGAADALKNAQTTISIRPECKSPVDWCGWVLIGEAW